MGIVRCILTGNEFDLGVQFLDTGLARVSKRNFLELTTSNCKNLSRLVGKPLDSIYAVYLTTS